MSIMPTITDEQVEAFADAQYRTQHVVLGEMVHRLQQDEDGQARVQRILLGFSRCDPATAIAHLSTFIATEFGVAQEDMDWLIEQYRDVLTVALPQMQSPKEDA